MTPKRRRVPAPEHGTDENAEGFPHFVHNAFTVEGEIERLGGIGRGLSTAPRWARYVARGVALIVLVPIAIGLVQFVVGLFSD